MHLFIKWKVEYITETIGVYGWLLNLLHMREIFIAKFEQVSSA